MFGRHNAAGRGGGEVWVRSDVGAFKMLNCLAEGGSCGGKISGVRPFFFLDKRLLTSHLSRTRMA